MGGSTNGFEAVVFDFDGLILETEEPWYLAWRSVWEEHGEELTLSAWEQCIGAEAEATFEPFRELLSRTGAALEEQEVRATVRRRVEALVADADVLPGVRDWIDSARDLGLGIAIASSSPRDWIDRLLDHVGLRPQFPVIACFDDVGCGKPQPDVYLAACRALGTDPVRSVAVEDSLNGVRAARAAGMPVIAVPTVMTRHLPLDEADLVVESLASIELTDALRRLGR